MYIYIYIPYRKIYRDLMLQLTMPNPHGSDVSSGVPAGAYLFTLKSVYIDWQVLKSRYRDVISIFSVRVDAIMYYGDGTVKI